MKIQGSGPIRIAVQTSRVAGLALLMVCVSTFLSGCKVGPEYKAPSAALNDDWLKPVPTTEPTTAPSTNEPARTLWWESFNDPTLTALVNEAYKQNLTLRVAGLRVLQARAQRGISVGQFFPQHQEANGSINNNQLSANSPFTTGDRYFADNAVGLEATWELDFWGKFRRGIEASDADLQATVADYDNALVMLAANVATNYITIRSLEERLVYAHGNVDLQKETLRLTNVRHQAGAVSELDVATARSTLATTEAQIPFLENQLKQAKLALCILLGRTPSELESELALPDANTPIHVPEPPQQIAAGIPADLLRRRPDVRAAERAAAAQCARIGVAQADLYPAVSILGSTGFVSSNIDNAHNPSLGNITDANSFAGFYGLQFHLPILNYGRIENNIRVQDAQFEQAAVAYQDTVLRAAADVEGGLSDFLHAREQSGYLSESVDAAQRSVDLSIVQYRSGAVDFIRVNDAQTALSQQQDQFVQSRAAIADGAIRTFLALGGGWEIRENAEFIDQATAKRMRDRTDWNGVMDPNWSHGSDLGFHRPQDEQPKK